MVDDQAVEDFPDEAQRFAVCSALHNVSNGRARRSYEIRSMQTGAGLELKASKRLRRIEGMASVFDVMDSERDIIVPGTFVDSISRRMPRIPMLWQHDITEPIGRPEMLREAQVGDLFGLEFADKVSRVPNGDKALTLIDDGVIDGISIGFEILEAEPGEGEDGEPVRFISRGELFEKSVVTFPANEAAFGRIASRFVRGRFGVWRPSERRQIGSVFNPQLSIDPDDEGAQSIGEALSLLLDQADGNFADILRRMRAETGLETEAIMSIISSSERCPTPAVVEGLARALGVDARILFAAGVRSGCSFRFDPDEPETAERRRRNPRTTKGIDDMTDEQARQIASALRSTASKIDSILKQDDEDDEKPKAKAAEPELELEADDSVEAGAGSSEVSADEVAAVDKSIDRIRQRTRSTLSRLASL